MEDFKESLKIPQEKEESTEKEVDSKYFLSERILPTILSNGTGGLRAAAYCSH